MEAAETSSGIGFALLGPLRAWRNAAELRLGPPQQRAVAAVLLLRRGRPVDRAELVRALWTQPPRSPEAVIRTYVWRLRQLLEPGHDPSAPWTVLRSAAGGYLLDVPEEAVDTVVFERRVAEAAALDAGGDPAAARLLYDSALALWHDEPLVGVPGPFAERERARLEARRLDVRETRLHTLVAAGLFAEAATEAAVLADQHPLREGLHHALMRALHGTGRQAEALAVYRDLRRLLSQELGIEPAEPLRALHAEILGAGRVAVRQGVVHRRAPLPRQIPHGVADFTGRAEETERIRDALRPGSPEALPIVLVTGMAGAGKTTLVMHAVQPALTSYPDGQLYADLRGADGTPADPAAVLGFFLRSLGESEASLPDDPAERAAQFRSVLAGRRVLIVLDNARDTEQIAPLLPGSPSCAVVVTSRNALATLPVSARVTLGSLPEDDALQLLTRLAGPARVAAEPHAARQVLADCGCLPLAVRIVGARLAARPSWTLASLAERLADERQRLAELRVESVTVESSFALGHEQLDDGERRAFRLLSVPPHQVFDVPTAAAVLDAGDSGCKDVLERLVDAGLLQSPAWERYRYHDLVRLFAQRLAAALDPAAEHDAALARLLGFHLAAAVDAYRVLRPGHTLPPVLLPSVSGPSRFDDARAALAWGRSVLGDLLRLLQRTAASHTGRAAALLLALDPVLMSAHRWHDVVPVAIALAEAAARDGDALTEGRARYMLAGALTDIGRAAEALEHVRLALELSARAGDDDVHAMTVNVHAMTLRTGRAAVAEHRRCAALARRLGNTHLEALTLGNLVMTRLIEPGIDEDTVRASERQLELYRRSGDRHGEALGRYSNGQVLLRQGRPDAAIAAQLHTLELLDEGEQEYIRAGAHIRLAEAYTQAGRPDLALERAEAGLALSREIRYPRLEGLALRAQGDALEALRCPEQAWLARQNAVDILRHIGFEAEAEQLTAQLTDDPFTGRRRAADGACAVRPVAEAAE